LRLEKGYRYYGAELTSRETPYEAVLGTFVRLAKGEFSGRRALLDAGAPDATPARRLRTLTIGGEDWLPIYGGEAVRIGGEVVSRLRSAAFGYTVGRTVGTAYLPSAVAAGAEVEIDVFADRVAGRVAADVLVDADGSRMRG
jgi:glycine cleavage system aminomethyltransferase T